MRERAFSQKGGERAGERADHDAHGSRKVGGKIVRERRTDELSARRCSNRAPTPVSRRASKILVQETLWTRAEHLPIPAQIAMYSSSRPSWSSHPRLSARTGFLTGFSFGADLGVRQRQRALYRRRPALAPASPAARAACSRRRRARRPPPRSSRAAPHYPPALLGAHKGERDLPRAQLRLIRVVQIISSANGRIVEGVAVNGCPRQPGDPRCSPWTAICCFATTRP